MRKLASSAAAIALAVGLLAGFFLGSYKEWRPAGAAGPSGNGDTNGDGSLDLSDAIYLLEHLFVGGPPPAAIACPPAQELTVLVVRHAEKESTGSDPGLTPDGQARAVHLGETLARARIDAVFATEYRRTIETVRPTADARGLQVQAHAELEALVAALRSLPAGSVAALAGNSFNIPDILKDLGVAEAVDVPSAEYDNLWIVRFGSLEGVPASLVHLRY